MGMRSSKGLSPDGLESYYGTITREPYKPTTRGARRTLSSEEEAIIREGGERVRRIVALEKQWRDVES